MVPLPLLISGTVSCIAPLYSAPVLLFKMCIRDSVYYEPRFSTPPHTNLQYTLCITLSFFCIMYHPFPLYFPMVYHILEGISSKIIFQCLLYFCIIGMHRTRFISITIPFRLQTTIYFHLLFKQQYDSCLLYTSRCV